MGKYPVLCVLACAMALLVGCSDPSTSNGARNATPTLSVAGGESLDWSSLKGGWVLVNYWAEWCKPCLEEIPELNALDARDGVTVLAVNYDGVAGAELLELGERMGIGFTMLADNPAPVLGWDTPQGLPATFLVAPDGALKDTLMGAQTEEALLQRMGQD